MKTLLFAVGVAAIASAAPKSSVTFSKDVAPVLQNNCQGCHRPGEAAPFSLLTYQDARPWAKAIKQAVVTQKMPPWFTDSSVQHYRNDASLSTGEIETIVSW